jgi:hypothetical protein
MRRGQGALTLHRRTRTGPPAAAGSGTTEFAVAYEPSTTLLFARALRESPLTRWLRDAKPPASYAELTIKLVR